MCHGDAALVCSAVGNDLDEVQCPLGCDDASNGCRQCTANSQCSVTTPICESASSTCRGCQLDDECESRVCDFESGTCVPETDVVYATANDAFGTCTLSQPCRLDDAIVLATNVVNTPILRMLPGTYTTSLVVSNPTVKPLKVVGTGASITVLGDTGAIVVSNGGNVEIRGLSSTSEAQIDCGLETGSFSSLGLQDSLLTAIGSSPPTLIQIQRCALKLTRVEIAFNSASTILGTGNDASFEADRLYVHGNDTAAMVIAGERQTVRVSNGLFVGVGIVTFTSDASPPGTRLEFTHSTFVQKNSNNRHQLCGDSNPIPNRIVRFENIISVPLAAFDAFNGPILPANCSFVATILGRQATAPPGTIVADPQFVDLVGGDFHVSATSPAVDAAVTGTIAVDHDLDGIARPQGSASDIGAYELPQ